MVQLPYPFVHLRSLAVLAGLLLVAGGALAQHRCLVVGVSDGDTLKLRCGSPQAFQQVNVRLAEVDAPEKGQAFGQRSKESLSDLCFRDEALLTPRTTDRYGRTVGRVQCRGRDASVHQVQRGMAWAYKQYQTDPQIPRLEAAARAERAGLWSDQAPTAPWDWRREHRSK